MSEGPHVERRRYRRVEAAVTLKLGVELGSTGPTPAAGRTVNISRGGMLATVDRRLSIHSRCTIRFLDAGDRLAPTETAGRVLRVSQRSGGFLVAVEFDEPLERLDVERTLWSKPKLPFGRIPDNE